MLKRGSNMAGLLRPEWLNASATRHDAAESRASWGVCRHLRNSVSAEIARADASIARSVTRRMFAIPGSSKKLGSSTRETFVIPNLRPYAHSEQSGYGLTV